jgi:hypothetical protein
MQGYRKMFRAEKGLRGVICVLVQPRLPVQRRAFGCNYKERLYREDLGILVYPQRFGQIKMQKQLKLIKNYLIQLKINLKLFAINNIF